MMTAMRDDERTLSTFNDRMAAARQRLVDGFASLQAVCAPLGGAPLLDALEAQALYTHDAFVSFLNGSAPGDAPASAGSPPSDVGSPRLVSVATGADHHSVRADRLADVVEFRCDPDESCGQDGAA